MSFRFAAALTLPVLLAATGTAMLPAAPALALPTNDSCVITTYYNDAADDTVVGTRTHCTGSPTQMTGHTSRYAETMRIEGDGPHPSPSGGNQHLPCEFLAKGCSIFSPGHGISS